MARVIFFYEGIKEKIYCNANDKMKDIVNKFLTKINKQNEIEKLYILYHWKYINYDLTFNELANEEDRKKGRIEITVNRKEEIKKERKQFISKDVICPKCKENTFMDIKNFKINFYGCKNNHKINNIFLNEYEETQKNYLSSILCDLCKKSNKNNTINNEFFICNTCDKNICPLCKSNHDKKHKIINYDDKNYICKEHNHPFYNFCKTCNKDLCITCRESHYKHDIIDLDRLIFTKNERLKMKKKLKNIINKFKNKISLIKEILDKMVYVMELYYKINETIINNYNINKKNYHKLQNLYLLYNNNEKLIKDLNDMFNKDKLTEVLEFSFNNFYNENKEKYIGEMIDGLKEGKGILYYDKNDEYNRYKYEGDFKEDKRGGKGTIIYKNGEKYEGDFKNDIMIGKGIFYYDNGDKYEGDFKDNIFEGKGKFYYHQGDIYEGEWENDEKNGKGVFYYDNGDIYEGYFKDDMKNGKGNYYFCNGDRFEGNYINGKEEGKGKYYNIFGGKFKGNYKNGKREGMGVMIWKNGDRYEGEWKNSLKDGKGIMYYSNGKIEKGYWKNGVYIGK